MYIELVALCSCVAVYRFLYVAHTGDDEILVYARNDDNSVKFSHVSEFKL